MICLERRQGNVCQRHDPMTHCRCRCSRDDGPHSRYSTRQPALEDLCQLQANPESMAKLLIKTNGVESRVLELCLGVNRVGRSPGNHFQLDHPTVSTTHCELVLGGDGVLLRDCDSTNGTFVNGKRVQQATLRAGQTVHLGDVELFVETTEVIVAIPQFDRPRPAPPVVLPNGAMLCPRHPQAPATHQCTHCHEVMCAGCVHHLRRHGGKMFMFCPLCSSPVEIIGGVKPKKKSFLGMLKQTVKVPFLRGKRRPD